MEEWVGSIWHRFITDKAAKDHPEAKLNFDDVNKSAGMIFRALGGDPAKRVEAATARDYLVRRNILQRISGSYQQQSLAWQDEDSLRLPESIALFPSKELNRDLYLWLAALAAQQQYRFSHWANDNQALVKQLLDRLPTWQSRYQRLVEAALAIRPPIGSLTGSEREMETKIVQALKHPGSVSEFPATNYAPAPVYLWLYPSAQVDKPVLVEQEEAEEERESSGNKEQQSAVARKKSERVDDPNVRDGMMIFRLESLFSWSEYANLDRGKDDSDDDDDKRVAEDIDKITLSKRQQQKTAKLKIDLDLPSAELDDLPLGEGIKLPEWHYKTQSLQEDRVLLQPMLPKNAHAAPLPNHLKVLARKIRSQFEQLQTLRQWHRNQPQGEELDLTAWLDYHVESQIAPTAEKGFFQTFKSKHRDLSTLLLADISMSTDAHLDNDNKVIDVIKDALLLFGEALSTVGDSFAMYGFSSVKRQQVRFTLLKNFMESYTNRVRGRIQSLTPGFYTRMGAAIRQSTKVLEEQTQSKKLLLIVTDGKPNDIDHYEGRFGIEDTRHAIAEARKKGIKPFCITIDQKADEYLPYLFGADGFTVILRPNQLPVRLPELYHQLTE